MDWRSRIVGYRDIAPAELKGNPKNWRKHPDGQASALGGVLAEVGVVQNVIWNQRTGRLVDGHLRVKLAFQSGQATIPVTVVDLSDDEEALILATIDPLSAMAETDGEALSKLLSEVKTDNADVQALIDGLAGVEDIQPSTVDATPQIDRRTELQKKWRTKIGQLWQIGEHRLLCGDCTDPKVVDRALGGERAGLCLTDPPYGVGEEYAEYNDTVDALKTLVEKFLPLVRDRSERVLLTPGNCNQWRYPPPDWSLAWFVAAGVGRGPWGFTCWQPIMAYGKDPYLQRGEGSRPDATNIVGETTNDLGHPCAKPVGFWSWLLERGSARPGEVVLDPFCGSGTTIIACERMKRRCRAIEIDPGYVAIALQRWADATGGTPTLVHDRD